MNIPERYSRNCAALSPEECRTLARKRVAVAGCGGLGGVVIEALARIGVGYLRVIDGDVFEESNLNRQVLCTETSIGRGKALVAAERISSINSEVDAEPVVAWIDESNASELLAGADCVVDCLDSPEARFYTARACRRLDTPIIYGAIAGWFGQVSTVYPGDSSYDVLYEGTREVTLDPNSSKARGNLPFAAFAIGALQASETVKVLLGRSGQLRNRVLMLDVLSGTVDEVELR